MLNGKMNIAIFISGGGTTMREVIWACKNGHLSHVNLAMIIASRPDAGGIEKARKAGFPEKDIVVIVRKDFSSPDDASLPPLPDFPETMKSDSASPILLRFSMITGRWSINILSLS